MHGTERPQADEQSRAQPSPERREVDWAALVDVAFQVMHHLLDYLRSFPERARIAHRGNVERAVAAKLTQFNELSALDEQTRDRIRPEIKNAEELLASREWETTFLRSPQLSAPILGGLTLGYWALIALVFVLGVGHLGLAEDNLATTIFLAGAVLIVRSLVHALVWWRLRPVARLLTAIALIIGTMRMGWWSGPVLTYLTNLHQSGSGQDAADLQVVDWPAALHGGMWLAAAAAVLGLLPPLSRLIYRRVVEASTYRKSSPAIQTALLLDEFLAIAHELEITVRDSRHDAIAYLAGQERGELMASLDELAARVRGPWARAMRTGHRSVDTELAQLCDRIAAAILRWRLPTAQGGARLADMRDAFALAVVNLCDSDYHLMAAEDQGATRSLAQRAAVLARRVVLIPVPLLVVLLIVNYVPGIPHKYDSPIIMVGILTTVGYLLTTLDTKFSDILTAASSLTQTIRK
ncbi:hypothetical protein E1264_28675 [Actinomadura sp. KC216]|uniref:hypothetical protein n=1 Tax=Actinomadura sp. KC216 TaxID=2530370 RepID=UPI00104E3BE9|nr:hypothetical protein [Actinomadura sp. KC216]TDB83372.1 hypothetical protein E1264_28675 [Actinomadura sp. KC216]